MANDANNSVINVDELMQKIQEEVAKRQGHSQSTDKGFTNDTFKVTANIAIGQIEAFLRNGESRAYVRTKWPDNLNKFPLNITKPFQKIALAILNFIFKDQREVNFNVIQAFKESIALNRQLVEQVASLKTQIDVRSSALNDRLQVIEEQLTTVYNQVPKIDDNWDAINTKVDNWISNVQERLDAAKGHRQLIDEHLKTVDTHTQEVNEHLKTVDTHIQEVDECLSSVDNRLQAINERLGSVNIRLQDLDQRHFINDSYLKNDLIQQKRLVSIFLEEARRRLPEPFSQEQLQIIAKEEQHLLDAFYVAFEDQFRGSREVILNRLKVYLPIIQEAKVGTLDLPILDVGCGRGEWLELLRESGYAARGVDINRAMLEQCRNRELEVIESDVIAYLQSLPDDSLGAVTGFHIIEHLPFKVLMKLFDETMRILKSGGVVIFETPNPRNILVGSGDFYRDPTHRNPIHPDTLSFLAESKGFVRSESYFFAEKDGESPLFKSSQTKFDNLNDYINISRDYAMIAYKL